MISQDEVVTNNGDTKWLPYKTRMSPALPGTRGLTELSPKACGLPWKSGLWGSSSRPCQRPLGDGPAHCLPLQGGYGAGADP